MAKRKTTRESEPELVIPFVTAWLALENMTLSETSQASKDKHRKSLRRGTQRTN